ncbi:MAG: OmpA family protein [Rhizobiaceae bacterium]|nr:OmpA family protein [Rhizobiaceae bacterium]
MFIKGSTLFGLAFGLVVHSTQFAPALAQSNSVVDSSAIVKGLTQKNMPVMEPKAKGKTRSLKMSKTRGFKVGGKQVKPGMAKADREFLKSVSTRGIKFTVAQKEKVYAIVDKGAISTYDFEINFEFGSAEIRDVSKPQLLELAKALNHATLVKAKLMLVGHTDAVGSREANQNLSERRAFSIADFLTSVGGIDGARLVPFGYGEDRLKNNNDGNAAENRRVEVINITAG